MIRDTEALLQGAFPCLVWTASGGLREAIPQLATDP